MQTARPKLSLRMVISIVTWNFQGLVSHPGKLDIIEQEVENINIVGLCETHWTGSDHFISRKGNAIYYSGNQTDSIHGVAVIIPKKLQLSVLDYRPINSRILTLKINAKPCNINLVQVYAPTTNSSEDEITEFYHQPERIVQGIPNKEMTIVQDDFNAKIGQTGDRTRAIYGWSIRSGHEK